MSPWSREHKSDPRIVKRLLNPQTSIHLYVGFLAQTSQPAFLHGLRFFRDQFFLDLVADFGEGAGDAAVFIFDFKNVIVAARAG